MTKNKFNPEIKHPCFLCKIRNLGKGLCNKRLCSKRKKFIRSCKSVGYDYKSEEAYLSL